LECFKYVFLILSLLTISLDELVANPEFPQGPRA
jgi:hypothetical protein